MNINDLWIVSIAILDMSASKFNTIAKDFYFTKYDNAEECYEYFKKNKNVCGLSFYRFIDTIQTDINYKS